jgi:hypothetical protein
LRHTVGKSQRFLQHCLASGQILTSVSDFQNGAYREALKVFARAEVPCVTYAKLADFIAALPAETLAAAYRDGDFPRAGDPTRNVAALD